MMQARKTNSYRVLLQLAFNPIVKHVNADIGDPLANKSQFSKVQIGLRRHNIGLFSVTTHMYIYVHKLTHTHMHDTCRPCTLEQIFYWHPTHLVFVLRTHVHLFNEVACYLTVAILGCPVEHCIGTVVLVMDPCSKVRQQEFDHFQLPTCCSHVHGIVATLYQVTTQIGGQSKWKFTSEPRCEAILRCSLTHKTRQDGWNSNAVLYRGGACKWTGCVKQ